MFNIKLKSHSLLIEYVIRFEKGALENIPFFVCVCVCVCVCMFACVFVCLFVCLFVCDD